MLGLVIHIRSKGHRSFYHLGTKIRFIYLFFRVFRELVVSTLCFHDDEDTVNKLKLLFSNWMKTNGYVRSSKSLFEHFQIVLYDSLPFLSLSSAKPPTGHPNEEEAIIEK